MFFDPSLSFYDAYCQQVQKGTLSPDPAQITIVSHLFMLQQQLVLKASKGVRGVYLYGGVGRGKTLLMDGFYQTLSIRAKRRVHFHVFMQEIHQQLHMVQEKRTKEAKLMAVAQRLAKQVKVLCLDELHVVDIVDAMLLSGLFTALLRCRITVIITSNQAPEGLYSEGLQRDQFLPFIALLRTQLDVLCLEGSLDYRLEKRNTLSTSCITPIQEDTAARLYGMFEELSLHSPIVSLTLNVRGERTITLSHTSASVAFFTFSELYEVPFGAAEYTSIAAHFEIVIVHGIPSFTAEQQDLLYRFILSIDIFYDNYIRFICSTAVPIAALYTLGPKQDLFTRTQSRLIEMQSPAYLTKAYHYHHSS